MVIAQRSVVIIILMIIFMPLFCGQASQTRQYREREVRLLLAPFDQFTRAIGIEDEKVLEAARRGIAAAGFRVAESADVTMSVAIHPLPQKEEDRYSFRIELHAGSTLSTVGTSGEPPPSIGDMPEVRSVEVPWHGYDELLAMTTQMATRLAVKLRRELEGRSGASPIPFHRQNFYFGYN